jgi:asparagine synthase (glutamine-hydrolysing)
VWVTDQILLLGFPASPDGTPWGQLDRVEAERLARAALDGSVKLRGGWTLVAVDDNDLVVRTDGYGTRPLFFRTSPDKVTLSEEIWPLLDDPPELDPVGISDFLVIGYHLGKATGFLNVSSTEANTLVRFGPSGTSERRLPVVVPHETRPPFEEAVESLESQLIHLFEPYRDVERLLIGLSGGLDSRVLLAVAAEKGLAVHAWTFALVRNSEEEALARAVARTLGVAHTVSFVASEDLLASAPEFVRASSGQQSLEHVHGYPSRWEPPSGFSVHADGIYGGPICGGSLLLPEGTRPELVPQCIAFFLAGRDPDAVQRRLPGIPGWSERIHDLVDVWYSMVNRTPRLADLVEYQTGPGRMSVWWSLASRDRFDYIAPFLDEDLVRVVYGMPEEYQRDARAYRAVITRRWPALARIPWEKTGRPVARYPGRLAHRIRSIRRWYGIGRPIAYFDRRVYGEAFEPLMRDAMASLTPLLADIGIDLEGLLQEFGESEQALRLRVASVYLMLKEARVPVLAPPAPESLASS